MIPPELEAKILKLYHADKWTVGTISKQLGIHHNTVERVLSQGSIPFVRHHRRRSIVDPYIPFIIETLTYCDVNIPQVWNSNMYLTEKSMKLLHGLVDVYLTDFKYGNNNCAKRLSNVKDYWEIITRNHKIARAQCEMIIRHLVLPGHFKCCSKPILEWIAENLENVRVNVMDQYRPEYNAYDYKELTKRLDKKEFLLAFKHAKDLGLSLTD